VNNFRGAQNQELPRRLVVAAAVLSGREIIIYAASDGGIYINNRGSRDILIRSLAQAGILSNRRESTEYRSAILADSCRAKLEMGR